VQLDSLLLSEMGSLWMSGRDVSRPRNAVRPHDPPDKTRTKPRCLRPLTVNLEAVDPCRLPPSPTPANQNQQAGLLLERSPRAEVRTEVRTMTPWSTRAQVAQPHVTQGPTATAHPAGTPCPLSTTHVQPMQCID
jgi:hypothetical protein